MEAYPPDYVEHNLPLVFLSGLGERTDGERAGPAMPRQESGTRIVNSSEVCQSNRAAQLLEQFLKQDGSKQVWNSSALSGPNGVLNYRMKAIGRTFTLPARKAAPLAQSPDEEGSQGPQSSQHRSTELHSPLSPSSPGSPIYPDGVLTPLWVAKHQQLVPSLLIAFFNVSADESTGQNEQIQIDINAIRTALGRSGYKTKFAAVLMSDTSILHAPELEDRISAIRRATTLDVKTGLFFMPPMSSQAEIATFVQTMLATLQPLVVEYYRDLTKHARRKKARGGPILSVTSPVDRGGHALSTPGWNARYEVKQGVFAEFRQEMDVAERHYSAAIEELFGSEGILETTPSWSPRWNEARLLCDVVGLRILRCQLWSGLTTGATVSWVNYKARTRDMVDRRGKGSQTYGWDAWESRWAEIMAQLIQRAALPTLQPAKLGPEESAEIAALQIYAPPEKSLAAERTAPFALLHHPGYWLRLAFDSARDRREKAMTIPEEDRISPGQSPASAVVQRAKNYDTYLAAEPHEEYPSDRGYDHIAHLRKLSAEAIREFSIRGQIRSAERLRLDLGQQLAQAGQYTEALETLVPFWEDATWRADNWEDLFCPLVMLLHDCAAQTNNAAVFLTTAWETLGLGQIQSPLGRLDLADYVGHHKIAPEKFVVNIHDQQKLSPIAISFAFGEKDIHVGEPIECQLILASLDVEDSAPIALSRVEIMLGNMKSITIHHRASESWDSELEQLLDLSNTAASSDGSLTLDADLTLRPSQKRIYSFFMAFREAGNVSLRQATISIDSDTFALKHVFTDEVLLRSPSVYLSHNDKIEQSTLPYDDTTTVTVLPKPPKMQLLLHGLHKHYYVDEHINLDVELVNGEVEAVLANAALRCSGQVESPPAIHWDGKPVDGSEIVVGRLDPGGSYKASLEIAAPSEPSIYSLEVEIRYTLESDANTPLVKTLTTELNISTLFEAKYNFGPLLHPGPWPSYFIASSNSTGAEGIPQRWRLGSQVKSVAPDDLTVRRVKVLLDSIADGGSCSVAETASSKEQNLAQDEMRTLDFEFSTQRMSLDDRRPTDVELSLDITWSRNSDSAEEVTTSLPVPRLTLPSSEPRVLCTVDNNTSEQGEIVLHYHLENPSTHFLTFALTMEANDDFAFSGPKYRTLSLAPLSRLRVDYHLLLHDQGESETKGDQSEGRWIWPVLQVVDSYYQKTLRVHSGGPEVKVEDKRGLTVLVDEASGR